MLMNLDINLVSIENLENSNFKLDPIKFQKMIFLYNTIEQGWSVKKKDGSYVFTKSVNDKKEVLADSYLLKFMKTNLDLNKFI